MTDDDPSQPKMSRKALEMVMRDVLDGLTDLAVLKSWEISSDVMQILAIEPPHEAGTGGAEQTSDGAQSHGSTPVSGSAPGVVALERYRNRKTG